MEGISKKLQQFIKDHNLFSSDDKLLVAASGGPDSMMLLCFLVKYLGLKPAVAHVNYHTRAEDSLLDEQLVASFAMKHQLPYYTKSAPSPFDHGNFQEEARKFRYSYFEQIMRSKDIDYILTAHHLDDSLETTFLHLLRGTGLKGLSGIPIKNGNIRRPLLCLTKSEIYDWLNHYKYPYRIDDTNLENKYNRNYIRNKIKPLLDDRFPAWKAQMLRTQHNISLDAELIKNLVKNWIRNYIDYENHQIRVPIADIPEPKNTFLFHFLNESFNEDEVNKLRVNNGVLIQKGAFKIQNDRNYIIIQPCRKDLQPIIFNQMGVCKDPKVSINISAVLKDEIEFNENRFVAYFSLSEEQFPIRFRKWKTGDRIKPLGMNGHSKLISDILIDRKVSLLDKEKVFVLEELKNSEIIWLVGFTVSELYKVKPDQKCVRVIFDLKKESEQFEALLQNFGI